MLRDRRVGFARRYGGELRAAIGEPEPPTRVSLWSEPMNALVASPRSKTACAPTQSGSWLVARGSKLAAVTQSVSQSLGRPAVRYEVGSVNERDASFYLYSLLRALSREETDSVLPFCSPGDIFLAMHRYTRTLRVD